MYGGRTSDEHIVRDSGFYDISKPFDQVMAERGFNLTDSNLTIPPSAANGTQMCKNDVRYEISGSDICRTSHKTFNRLQNFENSPSFIIYAIV